MPHIKRVSFRESIRPLRTAFTTSLGSKQIIRNMLIEVVLDDGVTGRGEAPTSFTRQNETIPCMAHILSACAVSLKGVPLDGYGKLISRFRAVHPEGLMTISALEVALFRAFLESRDIDEWTHWGGKLKEIETDITLPFLFERESLRKWIRYGLKRGFRVFKVKVSGDVEKDRAFLALVRSLLQERETPFTLRLDGNQGYTPGDALSLLDRLTKERYPIQLFEQPVAKGDLEGLKRVKEGSPVPVIADEAVETAAQLERIVDRECAHGVNLKIAKSGIAESAKIIDLAGRAGMKLMIGCMTETMTGLSAAIYMAAGQGVFEFIDLDSIHFLHHRNRYNDISVKGPVYLMGGGSPAFRFPS